MDSVAVAAINANTAAVASMTGVMLVFMGVLITVACGYLIVRYTLRG